MLSRPRLIIFSLFTILGLSAALLSWTRSAAARPIAAADFPVPMSASLAGASLASGVARNELRSMTARAQLGAIDPKVLPLIQTVYFAQTGHHLSNRTGFLDFWRAHGQVAAFGYPISEEVVEDGRIVQYFERARFEYVAEQGGGRVQLGLVSSELAQGRGDTAFTGVDDPQNGYRYFPETRHTLWGDFRYFWETRGGLEQFGYPISEELEENGRTVQYFERARFEYYPEDLDSFFQAQESYNGFSLHTLYQVRMGDVGRQLAAQSGVSTSAVAPLAGAATWVNGLWERRIEVDLSRQWLTAYEGDVQVYSAPVATGRDGFNTPTGTYAIYYRLPMQDMAACMGGECWSVPHIPWVQYVVGGVALHGTYWHNAHGTGVRMSHGCINLRIEDAQWIYAWADIGTTVHIHY